MKWTEKKKKYVAVGAGGVICVLLLIAISLQFTKKPAGEDKRPDESQAESEVVVEPASVSAVESREAEIVIHPNTVEDGAETGQPVDSRPAQTDQAEQSIQPEVTKPAEPEEAVKTDPTKKPDGTKVETPPTAEEHDSYTSPIDAGSENSGGGLPGFDNVPDGGSNQVIHADDMYENGNKIGVMD